MTEEDLLRKAVCKAASDAGMTAEEAAMMASRTVQIHEISKDAKSLLKKIVGIAIQGIDLTDMRGINLAGSLIFSGLLPIIWQSLLLSCAALGEETAIGTLRKGELTLTDAKTYAQIYASLLTDVINGDKEITKSVDLIGGKK